MNSLYEISSTYLAALNALTDPEADIPADAMRDTMEGLEGQLQDKAINVAKYIRNMETQAQAIKDAEVNMTQRRKAIEAKAARLKGYLKDNMNSTGMQKIPSPWFVLSVQKNPESVNVIDETAIPGKYKTLVKTEKVDKTQVKAALKLGIAVPGAELVSGTRLAIK